MDLKEKIREANAKAIETIAETNLVWTDVKPAIEVIPGMKKNMVLHSGPPIKFGDMCSAQQKGVCGAAIFEGLADNMEEAEEMFANGELEVDPCHHHQTTGSMAGITSASMPVLVSEDRGHNDYRSYILVHEGSSTDRIAYGAWSEEIHENLKWIRDVLGPALSQTINMMGELPVVPLIAKSLTMGDECHNRPNAGTALFISRVMPYLVKTDLDKETIADIANFLAETEHFFFHFGMAYGKAATDACEGIEYCSLVTAMARNGVEFGIRVAGLPEQWFTGKAAEIDGVYFPGYGPEDAAFDMGDSSICETVGLGGFALAASIPMARAVGGTADDAIKYARQMAEITAGRHNQLQIPVMDFVGTPLGIDIRKVMKNDMLPIIDTAIAHEEGGEIGVGIARPPVEAFEKAIRAFSEKYNN
ncbi:MAG: DUF1116 domain-containing protein [Halanaerobiales bacterium]